MEPFAEPGDLCGAGRVGGIAGTLKPSPKTEGLSGPGKVHRGSPGFQAMVFRNIV